MVYRGATKGLAEQEPVTVQLLDDWCKKRGKRAGFIPDVNPNQTSCKDAVGDDAHSTKAT